MNHDHDLAAPSSCVSKIITYLLLFTGVFTLSWMTTFGWQNRELIIDLFYQSSLERHLIATGEAGPVTYHVYHSDFKALETLTQDNEEILGIELTRNRGIAAMAFTAHDVPAINEIRTHSAVSRMLRRNIPMICH